MVRKIYILWLQGFNNSPPLVKKCVESWKVYNPDWEIIKIDETNIKDYINLEKYIPCIDKKNITSPSLSDIIRIGLLKKYGGLWVDSTVFCNKPLDDWLGDYVDGGFVAIGSPAPDRMISSWFLYAEHDNYIIDKWYNATHNYWKQDTRQYAHHYFWFHYLFGDLYNESDEFRKKWDSANKIRWTNENGFARGFDESQITNEMNEWIKEDIDSKLSYFYKLTYKYDNSNNVKNSILNYFLSLEPKRKS